MSIVPSSSAAVSSMQAVRRITVPPQARSFIISTGAMLFNPGLSKYNVCDQTRPDPVYKDEGGDRTKPKG